MNRSLYRMGLIVSLALVATACNQADEEGEDVSGDETSAMDDGLTAEAVGSLESADPIAAAAAVVASTDPDGCRTRVLDAADPTIVHVYLNQCQGRFGRKGHHILDGELLLTFSDDGDGTLHVDKQSVVLTIDGRDASRSATADISFDGNLRHIDWHGETSTTNEDGEAMSRVADHQIDVDRTTHCAVLNGVASVERGDRHIDVTISDLTSCDDPAAGRYCPVGLIQAEAGDGNVHITKTFDGSATLTIEVDSPKGEHTKTVELDCTPNGG